MKKTWVITTLAALVLVVCVGSVLADDFAPPSWRGQPGTTFARWEFSTPTPNPAPEPGWFNPNGMPALVASSGFGQHWWDVLKGRQGVWPLSGEVSVEIPNYPIPNPMKIIWIQLTWSPQVQGTAPVLFTADPAGNPLVNATLVQATQAGPEWFHSIYQIILQPNPAWERVMITGGIDVDELVIDTYCVPEPSSLLALGGAMLGTLGFLRRKRS